MRGFKHIFVKECKIAGVNIKVGELWQCDFVYNKLVLPRQVYTKDDLWHLYVGFHELGHYILHKGDTRNYDDLKQRIDIELEADEWANKKMREYGYKPPLNIATLGLIARYLNQGGAMESYSIKVEDRFITLYRHGFEIFSQFISNLPTHPCIY